jgi:L-threonylcarbamoyladenylate synthase
MPSDQIYIYPTDTVWGIGCDIYSETGYEEIARIKKSSPGKPLSILFADVEDVLKSFTLPNTISKEWLEYFFSQESTLGVPVIWAKIKLPHWAHLDSDYISLRCITSASIKSLYNKIGNPFFTTSLNLQGDSPILLEEDAKKFCKMNCNHAIIIEDAGIPLSGSSSTMIFLDDNLNFKVKREGRKLEEIKVLLHQLRLA